MRGNFLFVMGFALTLALPSTMLLADGPTRKPTLNQPFTVDAGLACSFPLHGEQCVNFWVVADIVWLKLQSTECNPYDIVIPPLKLPRRNEIWAVKTKWVTPDRKSLFETFWLKARKAGAPFSSGLRI
jgi:hypothetical protein